MGGLRPAWSSQFDPERLPGVEPEPLLDRITPAEAWGGSTGRGVRVAVIDSGIENSHPAIGGAVRAWCLATKNEDGSVSLSHAGPESSLGQSPPAAGPG